MMRNLQSKNKMKTTGRANDASAQKSVDIDLTRARGQVDANEINIEFLTRLRAQKTAIACHDAPCCAMGGDLIDKFRPVWLAAVLNRFSQD
jgi:hypothetical protein